MLTSKNIIEMETKIFVIEVPTLGSILDKLGELVGDVIPKVKENVSGCGAHHTLSDDDFDDDDDFEDDDFERMSPIFKKKRFSFDFPKEEEAPHAPWGIAGTPADENMRFGAAFEIDEPRSSDYESRLEFEDDHSAFDRFVTAGEDCVRRGLEKTSDAPIHKCNAIRKKVDEVPPMDIDLIGETDWWNNL